MGNTAKKMDTHSLSGYYDLHQGYIEPLNSSIQNVSQTASAHTTLRNVGGGAEVYKGQTGSVASLRTVEGTGDITITQNTDTISVGSDLYLINNGLTGESLVLNKTDNLNIKSLTAGDGVTIANTIGNKTLTISADITGATNINPGDGVIYDSTSGGVLNFKSLTAGTGITIQPSAGTNIINATQQTYTASSLSSGGTDVYSTTTANDHKFRGLKAGTGISLSSDANDITITNTLTTGTGDITGATNLGTGTGIYAQKNGANLEFKSLKAGANTSISANGTEITISSSVGAGGGDVYSNVTSSTSGSLLLWGDTTGKLITTAAQNITVDASTMAFPAASDIKVNAINPTAGTTDVDINASITAEDKSLVIHSTTTPTTPSAGDIKIWNKNTDDYLYMVTSDSSQTRIGNVFTNNGLTQYQIPVSQGQKQIENSGILVDVSRNITEVNSISTNYIENQDGTGAFGSGPIMRYDGTITARWKNYGLAIDQIGELTANHGVEIDGTKLINGGAVALFIQPPALNDLLLGADTDVVVKGSSEINANTLKGYWTPENITIGNLQTQTGRLLSSTGTLTLGSTNDTLVIGDNQTLNITTPNVNFTNLTSGSTDTILVLDGTQVKTRLLPSTTFTLKEPDLTVHDVFINENPIVLRTRHNWYGFRGWRYLKNAITKVRTGEWVQEAMNSDVIKAFTEDSCPNTRFDITEEHLNKSISMKVELKRLTNTAQLRSDFIAIRDATNTPDLQTALTNWDNNHVIQATYRIRNTEAKLLYDPPEQRDAYEALPYLKPKDWHTNELVSSIFGALGNLPVIGTATTLAFQGVELMSDILAETGTPSASASSVIPSPFTNVPSIDTDNFIDNPETVGCRLVSYRDYNHGLTSLNIQPVNTAGAEDAYLYATSNNGSRESPILDVGQGGYDLSIDYSYTAWETLVKFKYSYLYSRMKLTDQIGDPGLLRTAYIKSTTAGAPRLKTTARRWVQYKLDFTILREPQLDYITGNTIQPSDWNCVYINDVPYAIFDVNTNDWLSTNNCISA